MKKDLHWWPLYHGAFERSTRLWPDEAVGAYLRLLNFQWDHGAIPTDMRLVLKVAASARRHWALLGPKFPGGVNAKLESVRDEQRRKIESASERGRRGAAITNRNRYTGRFSDRSSDAQAVAQATPERDSSDRLEVGNQSQRENQNKTQDTNPSDSFAPSGVAKPPRTAPKSSVSWSLDRGWDGVTEADRIAWATAYPACDLSQLAASNEWLIANPAKAKKSNWRRFLVSWLTRSQDRGGDVASAIRHGANNGATDRRAVKAANEYPESITLPRLA